MNLDEKALIFLDSFEFLTYQKKENICRLFDNLGDILNKEKFSKKKTEILKAISEEEYVNILKYLSVECADRIIEYNLKHGVNMITRVSDNYSEYLINIDTPPFVLYYTGDINLINTFCLSIVGTRKPTPYGVSAAEKFTRDLVKYDVTIISGLAYGIDSVAHNTTVDEGGKTIAVVAGGLDNIYPQSNMNLAKRIVENGGLVLSEHRLKIKPESYMFPIRNRIIAGLSRGVLVVEASIKSGTMHTKNFALDYQREVFAVPGSIFSEASSGTNKMITESNAKLVSNVDEILEEFSYIEFKEKEPESLLSSEEEAVINLLKEGEKSFQEIVEKVGLETSKLNTLLTKLAIRGIIKKHAGNVYFLIK